MGQQHTAIPEMTGHPFRDLTVIKAAVRRNWQELIQLNLWFLLTCLPIITIPAVLARAVVLLIFLLLIPVAPLVFLTFLFFLPGLITACCAWPGIRQYLVKEDGASSD